MKIIHSGQKNVPVTNSLNGTFSIDLSVTSELAPSAQLIVYALLEEEVVADTANLNVDSCFQNQVSLTFSEEKATPASSIDVQVTGAPMSLCGIRVIDSSLLILSPYESFNADAVYNSLRYSSVYGYNVGGFDLEEPAPPCEDANKKIFYNGGYYTQTSSNSEGDTYNTLKQIGMIIGTNARLKKPVVCGMEPEVGRPVPFHGGGQGFGGIPFRADMKVSSGLGGGFGGGGGGFSIVTVRKNFVETFVWKMVLLDSEGRATLTEIIPDTITEWKGSLFCISENKGLGMTRSYSNLTSFMPFFMELSMPYSIIRGETLVLAAVISNYMDICANVTALLSPSKDFTAQLQSNKDPKKKNTDPDSQCICNKQRASFTYHVQAKTLGEISIVGSGVTSHIGQSCKGPSDASQPLRNDTVIQTLRVETQHHLASLLTEAKLQAMLDAQSAQLIAQFQAAIAAESSSSLRRPTMERITRNRASANTSNLGNPAERSTWLPPHGTLTPASGRPHSWHTEPGDYQPEPLLPHLGSPTVIQIEHYGEKDNMSHVRSLASVLDCFRPYLFIGASRSIPSGTWKLGSRMSPCKDVGGGDACIHVEKGITNTSLTTDIPPVRSSLTYNTRGPRHRVLRSAPPEPPLTRRRAGLVNLTRYNQWCTYRSTRSPFLSSLFPVLVLIPVPTSHQITRAVDIRTSYNYYTMRVISYNVKGLNSPAKRQALYREASKLQGDILCLQETHFKRSDHLRLQIRQYPYQFHATADTKSKGVSILISNQLSFSLIRKISDTQDRYLIIVANINEQTYTIAQLQRAAKRLASTLTNYNLYDI
ncbi:ovostatin-like [Pelobates cultripes]|uniref:Ovostatin-like n=1 Tax=Pelobates cultripes TaxID=61616 RepID=A0AAD1WPY9_PELCU|nr:ovostatin-like [Pelobates cultripes]